LDGHGRERARKAFGCAVQLAGRGPCGGICEDLYLASQHAEAGQVHSQDEHAQGSKRAQSGGR